jgi:hypothetical protein
MTSQENSSPHCGQNILVLLSFDARLETTKATASAMGAVSAFWHDLPGERLRDNLAVPHDKGVGCHLIRIVRRFRCPENVCIVAIGEALGDGERRAWFSKLCKDCLVERPESSGALEGLVA